MAKKAVSVTLDEANVLWLKGRARISGGNVSEALDQIITKARTGQSGPPPGWTSIVGTIDLKDDPDLSKAEAAVREWFDDYLSNQPFFAVNEDPPAAQRRTKGKRKRG
jgi:hypothetical protein